MQPLEMADFSAAMRAAFALSDNRGYASFARMHGWDRFWCTHSPQPHFLAWHRAYLYMMERALSDLAGKEIALPWWDWSNPRTGLGVPALFTDPQHGLAAAPVVLPANVEQAIRQQAPHLLDFQTAPPSTARSPGPPASLPSAQTVQSLLALKSFRDFEAQLEDVHDGVHVWFRRTMSAVVLAAFDPIFWAHHTMIDRIWYLWQLEHKNAGMDENQMHQALEGFPLTVAQVLNINDLGYEYAGTVIR